MPTTKLFNTVAHETLLFTFVQTCTQRRHNLSATCPRHTLLFTFVHTCTCQKLVHETHSRSLLFTHAHTDDTTCQQRAHETHYCPLLCHREHTDTPCEKMVTNANINTQTECNFFSLKCRLRLTCLVTHVLGKLFTHAHTHLHCTDICITVFTTMNFCLSMNTDRMHLECVFCSAQ